MDSNNNTKLEKVKEMTLRSDSSISIIKSENSDSSAESLKINKGEDNINIEKRSPLIKEVYVHNLKPEMKKIKSIIKEGKFTYVGMDPEFPGIIKKLNKLAIEIFIIKL